MEFVLKYPEIFVSNICSLKCELCSLSIPYAHKSEMFSLEEIFAHIDACYQIADKVERIQPMGGEALMHPGITEIIAKMLEYRDRTGYVRIVTNGNHIPNESLIALIKKNNAKSGCHVEILMSNYGELSSKFNEIKSLLEERGVPLRIDNYSEDKQYCDGWVNMGLQENKEPHSPEETYRIYKNCIDGQYGYRHFYKGKIYPCCSCTAAEISHSIPAMENAVELFDSSTVDEKRKKLLEYDSGTPFSCCAYCNGMNKNSPRVKGAKQI